MELRMNSLSFTPKTKFLLLDRPFQIEAVTQTDKGTQVQVIGPEGIETTKSLQYLLRQYDMGNLKAIEVHKEKSPSHTGRAVTAHPLAADLPKDDLEEGRTKWKLLCSIKNEGGFVRGNNDFWKYSFPELCAKYQFAANLSRGTIDRWIKKVIGAPDVPPEIALTPMHRLKGGAGRTRMDDQVLALTDRCIEDIFLSNPGASIHHCHLELVKRVAAENRFRDADKKLKCPSYQQLRRHVQGMSAYEICASRNGKATADNQFRSTRYLNRRLRRALQRVEVDHTPIDVFIVDDKGAFLGRARLTIVMDVATRAILGFSIGHDGTSVIAVLEALRHAVSPKTYLKQRYPQIQNDWPMCGCFELLAMDNGSEFHAAGFKLTLRELCIAIELAYMPRRKGNFKGTVEAIQKYINRDMSDLQQGATQSHHWQRNQELPPEQYAVHTLASLTELVHMWICDIYHARIHRGLKTSPSTAWRELTALTPVRLPASTEMMELACTELIERRIQPYGVEVCEVRAFNCEQLQNIRRLYQHKGTVSVSVRFKPKLLDRIWVRDPDSLQWFEIPNGDWQTRDKSQFQLQYMNKMIREAATNENLTISMAQAYERMREVGGDLRNAKTIAQRKRALRLLGIIPEVDVTKASPVVEQASAKQAARPRKAAAKPAKPPKVVVPDTKSTTPASHNVSDDSLVQPPCSDVFTPFRMINSLATRRPA
jgi:putative transposase